MIKTKTLATAIALILTLSIVTTAFAQNQTSGATGLQIQVVPQIQRGHQQHLTIFSVDDQGNEVNASEIQTTITNEKGNLVGPKTLYTNTGEDVAYKVGPNTSPQNITVDSCSQSKTFVRLNPIMCSPRDRHRYHFHCHQ